MQSKNAMLIIGPETKGESIQASCSCGIAVEHDIAAINRREVDCGGGTLVSAVRGHI